MVYLEKNGIETEKFEELLTSINSKDLVLNPIVDGKRLAIVTGLAPGPRLGRLKGWLHRRQIEEASRTEDEVLRFLSEIDWKSSDYQEWRALSWP